LGFMVCVAVCMCQRDDYEPDTDASDSSADEPNFSWLQREPQDDDERGVIGTMAAGGVGCGVFGGTLLALGYGCYCGPSKSGYGNCHRCKTVKDPVDECCRIHDECYDQNASSNCWFCFISYWLGGERRCDTRFRDCLLKANCRSVVTSTTACAG